MGKPNGGFQTGASSGANQVKHIVIKVKNFGTATETEVRYKVAGACSDEDGDGNECSGGVTYSAACKGSVGPLAPGQKVNVPGCKVTYAGATGDDKWLHTLVITHCGTDGIGVCTSNDGATDSNTSNNLAIRKTKVTP